MKIIEIFTLCALGIAVITAELIEHLSFSAPFNSHDVRGSRRVPGFKIAGDVSVLQNFVRITPANKYKRGVLESTKTFMGEEVSITFKYRISGAGDIRGSGDVMGFWLTTSEDALKNGGPVYGMPSNFQGIGVLMDTSRNGLSKGRHKDIRLLISNGQRTEEDLLMDSMGCSSNFRYQEDRDDFDVGMVSRVRLQVTRDGGVVLEVDSRNLGRWRTCTRLSSHDLPQGWLANARIVLLGQTTEKVNNQDVLALQVYNNAEEAITVSSMTAEEELDELELVVHRLEHDLFDIKDRIQRTLDVLEEKEKQSETRIEALETRLSGQFEGKLSDRISKLEREVGQYLSNTMLTRVQRLEQKFEEKIEQSVSTGMNTASKAWRLPFLVLLVFICIIIFVSYKKYLNLRKSHLL